MTKPLYIYSSNCFLQPVKDALPNLKGHVLEVCGKSIRRIDRLTQLALIGCIGCKGDKAITERTGLYLSSTNGSLNNMTKVLSEIYEGGEFPRPLSFVNTVSNSSGYYLARELGVLACNQFISCSEWSFESAVKLAQIDLQLGKVDAAFVGVISEVGPDFEAHRKRIQLDESYGFCEGSHWLYLSENVPDEIPLAELAALEVSVTRDTLNERLAREEYDGRAVLIFGEGVQPSLRAELLAITECEEADCLLEECRHESLSAIQITRFLSQPLDAAMIYVDRNSRDRFSLVIIKRV